MSKLNSHIQTIHPAKPFTATHLLPMGTRCTIDSFWICWQLRSTTSSSLLMLCAHVLSTEDAVCGPANLTMPDSLSILADTALDTTSSDSASSVCTATFSLGQLVHVPGCALVSCAGQTSFSFVRMLCSNYCPSSTKRMSTSLCLLIPYRLLPSKDPTQNHLPRESFPPILVWNDIRV